MRPENKPIHLGFFLALNIFRSFFKCGIIKIGGGVMIEHIYIKNYKAFEKENIPLEEHGLLIGTNNSGKTTLLEALDLFFNDRMRHDYIRNQGQDVKIECSINEKRYRKVFSPPNYELNMNASIGDFSEIKDLVYVFIPKHLSKRYLMNELLRVNMHTQVRTVFEQTLRKAYDYLDGELSNSDIVFSRIDLNVDVLHVDENVDQKGLTNILKNVNHHQVIVGIDHFEEHFEMNLIKQLSTLFIQSIITTKDDSLIEEYPHHVQAMYKEDALVEPETPLRVSHNQYDKTMLLVEGKYDVAWFEKALKLLGKYQEYRVIPCGGYGNIPHIEEQLKKAGFKTLVITDGDVKSKSSLKKEVIELYADVDYVNRKFHTNFDRMPTSKWRLFKAIHIKDDVVKKVLSSWAKNHMSKDTEFVKELNQMLSRKKR